MFGDGASLFASPGRVNLIGEHTDYNLGFVLPGAIDKAIYVALKPNDGTVCRVYSLDYDETVELNLHGEKPSQQWACYVYGVCQEMEKRGALILPFDMAFGGDVPLGAGLSSSAALESAVGFALNETYGLGLRPGTTGQDRTDEPSITTSASAAVSWTSSRRCSAEAGHVIRLDCRSLEYKHSNRSIRRAAASCCSTPKSSIRSPRRSTMSAALSARPVWPSCSGMWEASSRCAT